MKTMTKSLSYLILASIILMGSAIAIADDMGKTENKLNDLEIAHIAYTAGAIDIRYAHFALAISENPEVRKFAKVMIRDHSAVNKKALALVKKLQITPQDNPMSQQLNQQAASIRNELSQLRGKEFDQRYAANELGYHQAVNQAVEGTLIPNAKNVELKALLKTALRTFKIHEGHAEMMNKNVM